jgi:hypothetical protein
MAAGIQPKAESKYRLQASCCKPQAIHHGAAEYSQKLKAESRKQIQAAGCKLQAASNTLLRGGIQPKAESLKPKANTGCKPRLKPALHRTK